MINLSQNTSQEFENLIRQYVPLGHKSSKGYESTTCAVCNDYKARGGFKFDNDGIHYNCFNCGATHGFNASEGLSVSKNFKGLLTTFGIPFEAVDRIATNDFFQRRGEKVNLESGVSNMPVWSGPKEIVPPDGNLFDISTDDNEWCEVAREYLKQVRGLSPDSWLYFVSDSKRLEGRLIIPFMYKGVLIYWQARSMDDTLYSPRYINPFVEKDKVIFNIDEMYERSNAPLFVTEGPIDAISIGSNAISLSGSKISEWQLIEMRKASKHRKLIFVVDKNKNGLKLGLKWLSEGWYVTVLPDNIDDANDGKRKYGSIWLTNHLVSTAVSGFAGELLLKMKCIDNKQTKSKRNL
jgi:hypothetical protein